MTRRTTTRWRRGLFALAFLLFSVSGSVHADDLSSWVVSARQAQRLIADGDATVLDARSAAAFRRSHVRGAVRVDWTDFSQSKSPNKGKLLPADGLQAAIRAAGVDAGRPVIVVGDPPSDWGEDGRIVWMLRAAGHDQVALVDGGYGALKKSGVPLTRARTTVTPGNFEVKPRRDFAATRDEVRQASDDDDVVIVDTRTPREYRGATPHGASRGGHIPGAKNLHFRELMRPDGRLLPATKIRERLAALGASADTRVIAYCTGGVRSGWLVAVLRWAGFGDVRNYAGSIWDWAAAPTTQYPLK